jgi:hypothetical protein
VAQQTDEKWRHHKQRRLQKRGHYLV